MEGVRGEEEIGWSRRVFLGLSLVASSGDLQLGIAAVKRLPSPRPFFPKRLPTILYNIFTLARARCRLVQINPLTGS